MTKTATPMDDDNSNNNNNNSDDTKKKKETESAAEMEKINAQKKKEQAAEKAKKEKENAKRKKQEDKAKEKAKKLAEKQEKIKLQKEEEHARKQKLQAQKNAKREERRKQKEKEKAERKAREDAFMARKEKEKRIRAEKKAKEDAEKKAKEDEKARRRAEKQKEEEEELQAYERQRREMKRLKAMEAKEKADRLKADEEIQREEDEAYTAQLRMERKMRMEAAKLRYEEKLAIKIQEQKEKIELRKSADKELRKSIELKRRERERNTTEMQKQMEEAKKRFDRRRKEASLSPPKKKKLNNSYNNKINRNSRENIPKLEQSKSPMTKRQIKALKKKVRKEQASMEKFIEKNKNALSLSSASNLQSKKYAPGATGPYDILHDNEKKKIKGKNSGLIIKKQEDPEIVAERVKRREAAMKRLEKRKLQKALELRKSLNVKNENLRRSVNQIEMQEEKLKQAEKEKKMQKIVDEQKKKKAKVLLVEIINAYNNKKRKWTSCYREVISLGLWDEPNWQRTYEKHKAEMTDIFNDYVLEKEDAILRKSVELMNEKKKKRLEEERKRSMKRISMQNFKFKSQIQKVIDDLNNLYEVWVSKDYKGDLMNFSVNPSKSIIGKQHLRDNNQSRAIWTCRVNDDRWWHVGLALRDAGIKLLNVQIKSPRRRRKPEEKEGEEKDDDVVKPLNVMDILRHQWIKWTMACGKTFENVKLSDAQHTTWKKLNRNNEVEPVIDYLPYTKRRFEKSEEKGEKNQYKLSAISKINSFQNYIYEANCLQAWENILKNKVPSNAILNEYLQEKGNELSGFELMKKYSKEDQSSKEKLLKQKRDAQIKEGGDKFKAWAETKDKLKVKVSNKVVSMLQESAKIPFRYSGKGKRPSADGSATEKVTQSTFAGDRVSLPEMNSALQAIAHGRNVFWALKANQEERNGPFKDLENSKLFLKRLVNMQKMDEKLEADRHAMANEQYSNFVNSIKRVDRAKYILSQLDPFRAQNDKMWTMVGRCMYAINPTL